MRLIIYDWLLVSVTNLCNQLVITQNKFLLSREHDFLYLLFGVWQFQGPLLEIFTANIGIYIYAGKIVVWSLFVCLCERCQDKCSLPFKIKHTVVNAGSPHYRLKSPGAMNTYCLNPVCMIYSLLTQLIVWGRNLLQQTTVLCNCLRPYV